MTAGTGVMAAQNYGPPGPPPGYGQHGDWENVPPEFREIQRRGFHDGIEGARRDFDNHRPPNVNNRDEFRDPKFIARPDRRAYREAFRRGYQVGVQHIYGNGRDFGRRDRY
jgi:ribosome modulation factor